MRLKNFRMMPILLTFLFLVLSCDNGSNPMDQDDLFSAPEVTLDGWETASLNDVGMDDGPIRNLIDDIEAEVYREVHSVVIVKNGRLVFEAYFPGHNFGYRGENYHGDLIQYNRDILHNTHSATKSVTSALVGIAIDQGFIQDVDEKVFDFFPQHADLLNAQKERITIEHCLTMTSGLDWNEWDVSVSESEHDIVRFNSAPDPVRYLLSKPVVTEPGASFYYNGGTVDLLGEIVRAASGMRVDDFSDQHLFGPLGVSRYQWQTLSAGIICCHGDIYIRPRDLAKFGALFLDGGIWDGQRIISEEWVQQSFEEYIPLPQVYWTDGYGYLWWLNSFTVNGETINAYKAMGWGGQEIFIFPDQNMVLVFTGANYVSDPPCDEIVTRYILPALP